MDATSLGPHISRRFNEDLEKLVETSSDWIVQRTGIKERHIAEKGTGTSDIAEPAARQAIAEAGITPEQIGFIVVGTTTPDTVFPSTACVLQAKIGAVNAWGYDLAPQVSIADIIAQTQRACLYLWWRFHKRVIDRKSVV